MHKLLIRNFGPIDQCEFTLNDFTILIGPQSSGKSTVSKLVYFFLNVRDEFVSYILDSIDAQKKRVDIRDFNKQIRRRFVEFWGPTPLRSDVYIRYEYQKDVWIEIKLDSTRHKFVNPSLSKIIVDKLYESFKDSISIFSEAGVQTSTKLFTTTNNIYGERSRSQVIESIRSASKELFNIDQELLFIPAGRSLLSTLSDQLQYIHPHQLDYPMRTFI